MAAGKPLVMVVSALSCRIARERYSREDSLCFSMSDRLDCIAKDMASCLVRAHRYGEEKAWLRKDTAKVFAKFGFDGGGFW